ncbi:MAG: phosphohistidine phosphatase SixA [Methanolinea sp.]|jgi:phosphohistidine phosphatase|nr:phosphohistidine phosphatase SixA [Methanolinea sp.]
MDLYILRHGKAGVADHDDTGDSGRHLTRQGREEIASIGAWMRGREMEFSVIASSPLSRAAETASILAGILGGPDNVNTWDELSIGSQPEAVLQKIREIPSENRVLLVGHEPQLSTIVSLLICARADCGIILKKGGIARIRLHENRGTGELLWLLTPGLVREWASRGG